MKKVFLILIFVFALFLRVYKLGQYPVGFLWDEAALGYNAYSILQTGRDEYGEFLPLIFKSFGDYKPGLYIYLLVPFIATLGLNEFVVRLPSALFGGLTVLMFYMLIKESLEKGFSRISEQILRQAQDKFYVDTVPVVSALLLAISPWHINFSRGAWELNVMLFELIVGMYFFARHLNEGKRKWLVISAIFFVLTLVTYQAAKLLMPCLVIGTIYFFRKKIKNVGKTNKIMFATLLLSGFLFVNFYTLLSGKAGRLRTMSLFSYPRSVEESSEILKEDRGNKFDFLLFHDKPVFFLRSFLGRYFNHFSGKFLFITGDWSNQRNGIVYQGVMYYADIIFLCLGLFYLFVSKRSSLDNFMLFWLILAPVPSALTRDSISSVRSFTMVIPLVYITAVGVNQLFKIVKKRRLLIRLLAYCLLLTAYGFLVIRMLDLYFVHDPIFTSKDRLFGYRWVMDNLKQKIDGKNKVIITNKYGQPYIFYLFYSKYDPNKYQKIASLKENPFGDVGEVERIDNIEFKKIYFPDDRAYENSLFIGDEFDLPLKDIVDQKDITLVNEIKFLNGKTAFRIVETK